MDSTCIVCCGSMESHLEAAQVKMGTNYPVYTLDRALHSEPKNMRQSLLDVLNALPESVTTVLIAMGYCGGSLDNYDALTIAEKNRLWKLVMKKATVYRTPDEEMSVHIYPKLPK